MDVGEGEGEFIRCMREGVSGRNRGCVILKNVQCVCK